MEMKVYRRRSQSETIMWKSPVACCRMESETPAASQKTKRSEQRNTTQLCQDYVKKFVMPSMQTLMQEYAYEHLKKSKFRANYRLNVRVSVRHAFSPMTRSYGKRDVGAR